MAISRPVSSSAPVAQFFRNESVDSLHDHPLTDDEDNDEDNDKDYHDCSDQDQDDAQAPLISRTPPEADSSFSETDTTQKTAPQTESWASFLLKKSLVAVTAFASAIPNAINAFCGTDFSPSDIKDAWGKMNAKEKGFSISRALSSLSINAIMNLIYFPEAISVLIENFKNIKKAPFRLILINLGGIANAIPAFALAYIAFLSLGGNGVAITFAILNSATSFTQSIAGLDSIISKLSSMLDANAKKQKKAVEVLESLNDNDRAELQAEIDSMWQHSTYEHGTAAEKAGYLRNLFLALHEKLYELAPAKYDANQRNFWQRLPGYVGLTFDTAFAALAVGTLFLTFSQVGFDGIAIITKLLSGKDLLSALHPLAKVAIGAPSGVVSALFFGLQAFEARDVAWGILQRIYHDPKRYLPLHLGKIGVLAGFNYFASGGMANVGKGFVDNNFFHLPNSESTTGKVIIQLNQIFGAVVNGKTTGWKIMLDKGDLTAKPQVKEVIEYFKDAVNHPISDNEAAVISKLLDGAQHNLATEALFAADVESQRSAARSSLLGMFNPGPTKPVDIKQAKSHYPHQIAKSMPSI